MATADEIKKIFTLEVSKGNLERDLKSAENSVKVFGINVAQIGKSTLGLFAVGAGIGAGVGTALAALAKEAANYADNIGKASQKTGTGTEFLSALAHGAKLADIEFDELTKGLNGFNRNVAEAAKGSDSAKEPFQALGINIRNTNGSLKTSEQMLAEVADRFQKMPDGIQKSALAQDLFTKSGAKLIPLLNGGSEGIRVFTEEAKKMGLIVTGEAAAAAEKFNDDLTRVQASVKGAGLAIGGALVPAFAELAKSMLDFINSPGVRDILGWSAQLIKFWSGNETAKAEIRIQNINRELLGLQKTRDAAAKLPNQSTKGVDDNIGKLNEEKRALELLVEARNQQGEAEARLRQKMAGAKPATFIPEKAQTDKAKNEIDSFFDSLTKQIDTINQKQIELKFGDGAGLAASLDAQFARLKEKLGSKIKAFPGLEEFFTQLRDNVVAADESLRRLQQTMKQLEGFDLLDASTGSKALEDLERDAAKTAKTLEGQLIAIEKAVTLEVLPESERRLEVIRREFEERKKLAMDYLATLKESGTTEFQIISETARVNADIAKSSQAAIQKINEENKRGAEEVTEFQRRAWERTADAIADTLNDLTSGQIKSWNDLAQRIERTLTSIVNEAAAAEIKKIILGPDYGKKGGELGGLAKTGMEFFKELFGMSTGKPVAVPAYEPSARLGGMTPVDYMDQEMGQQFAALSQTGTIAIEASSATAQTGLQALQAQAAAALQTSATTSVAGIETTGATAQAGINAVLQTLAAIAAAKTAAASSGGGGIPFLDISGGGAEGGGFDIFGGGGADFASQGAGGIGSIIGYHDGGPIGKQMAAINSGFKPNERMILAEDGEFMFSKEAVRAIGLDRLNFANEKLTLPSFHDGGGIGMASFPVIGRDSNMMDAESGREGQNIKVEFHAHGVHNPDEFRQSKASILSDLARAVAKGSKHN